MNLYVVGTTEKPIGGVYDAFVVRAKSEEQARELAIERARTLFATASYPYYLTCPCVQLTNNGVVGVILDIYEATVIKEVKQ